MTRLFRTALVAVLLAIAPVAAHADGPPLVSTTWLRQHLNDPNLVILDIFNGDQRKQFAAGHIPGALFTDFLKDGWRARVGAAPGMLPATKDAETLIGSFGIDNQSHVILVPGGRDKGDFNSAARIYWTFKVLGHDAVSILEGGDKAWFAMPDAPQATGEATTKAKSFKARLRPDLLATRDEVKLAVESRDTVLVDARPPEQYLGKAKSSAARVAGTIPGAVNAPIRQVETADGIQLASPAVIDAVLNKAGIKPDGKQVVFCNTGHLAPGMWFVLHEIKGNKNAKLYPGSMSDWTSDPALPVANMPQK